MAQSPSNEPLFDEESAALLRIVFELLRTRTGNDFSCYKRPTILRRIERRKGAREIDRLAGYVRFLQETPEEVELLCKELLIGVTNFFRDPGLFEFLKETAIPQLLERRSPAGPLRVWTPACSTGEETYSLAIVLRECVESAGLGDLLKIQVFATDLDELAIDKARKGIFAESIAADVSPERLERFFVPYGERYRIKNEIREMLVFAPQNILVDPPFTRLDILCCRNFLIYVNTETQRKVLPLLHYALSPGGLLILGSAESTAAFAHLFSPLDKAWNVFQRKAAPPPVIEKPSPPVPIQPSPVALLDKSTGLPREDLGPSVAVPEATGSKISGTRVRHAPLADVSVLIVAENPAQRQELEQILDYWSMKPDSAPDVPTALVKIHEAATAGWAFPVVIADALMPKIDGFTLAAWIKNDRHLRSAVILMISPADRHAHAAHCRQLEVIYLEKPVRESRLFSALMKALRFGGPQAPAPAAVDKAASELSSRPLRILLAEDRLDSQKLAVRILEKRGHTVDVADDGRRALQLLQEHAFDVVLMDVQMPTMDGLQATMAIRALADRQKAQVPIVAVTAQAVKGDQERCLAAGVNAYVTKPIDAPQLIALLEGVAFEASQPQ